MILIWDPVKFFLNRNIISEYQDKPM